MYKNPIYSFGKLNIQKSKNIYFVCEIKIKQNVFKCWNMKLEKTNRV